MAKQTHDSACHQSVISIDDISFEYKGNPVISNLKMEVLERDFVGLIGSNGAGKTTLLRMIVGLLQPRKGQIRLFGKPVEHFTQWDRVGYVPQKNSFNPLFPATVKEVVLSGLYSRKKIFRTVSRQDVQQCEDALGALGIEHLKNRKIGQLSGGQQQRVFLARALIHNPELLILDEPTVGIDRETQQSFFHMLKHMHQHHNMTFLMVSHDLEMMHAYLGNEPKQVNDKLSFYVKHSHELQNCTETDLMHSLKKKSEQLAVSGGRS